MAAPVKVLKAGRIECAIFHNDKYDSFSFKFQKSYQDKQGNWQNTDFFSDTDMGDLSALCDHIREARVKEKGQSKQRPQEETVRKVFQEEPGDGFQDDIPF